MRVYIQAITNEADLAAILRQIDWHDKLFAPEFVIVVDKDNKLTHYRSNLDAKKFIVNNVSFLM